MKQESVANTTHMSVFTVWMWKVLLIWHDRCYQQLTMVQCQLQHISLILTIRFRKFCIILKLPSLFSEQWWLLYTDRQTDRQLSLLYELLWQTTMFQTRRSYRQNLKDSENTTLYYTWLIFRTLSTVFIYQNNCFTDFICLLLKVGMNDGDPTIGPIQKSLPLLLDLSCS